MRILKFEIEKVLKTKILWGLLIVFLAFNILNIVNMSYMKNDVNLLNKIIDKVGLEINDNSKQELKVFSENESLKAIEIINRKTNSNFKTLEEALKILNDTRKFSQDELDYIFEASIIENYYLSIEGLETKYNKIDILSKAEETVAKLNLTGIDKKLYLEGNENFAKRLEEIKNNNENMTFFFNESSYGMHRNLFKDILENIFVQGVIIVLILTSFLYNYEFENNTGHLVYSCKKGRGEKEKLWASIICSIIFITILLVIPLSIFFTVFDYSRVFNSSIDSIFNWGSIWPHLSWYNLTVKEFLILNIGVIYIVNIMISIITGIFSRKFKNTYITFFVFALFYGIIYLIPSIINFSFLLKTIATFTPITLTHNIQFSFTLFSTVIPTKYFEIITIILWIFILTIGYKISSRKFKKEDI